MSTNSLTKEEDNESTVSPLSGNEENCDQLCNDLMTSSYNEISFSGSDEQTDIEVAEDLSSCDSDQQLKKKLSSSLSLPQLSSSIVKWTERTKASYDTENVRPNTSHHSDVNEIPDYVSYDGHMVSYVAQDFQHKLKHSTSSPDIEGLVAFQITSLTVECISTYETCLSTTCDVIDSNIKSMYQLMAKCEELNQSMKPIAKLSEELKEVKRLLELFEKAVDYKM
ncbi:unnamed protein product [Medioppia subpectinata]|uniref:BLOC-1-related complex subunit 6 C-terminal helix domain-containing protein n=1 Tax=Medioppia subpectinata TaxID=1979941 RepID=A0A7R9KWD7_9ACAR|nr:unnamed protein product [Medioppia subpectinata]CAG2111065.1 unnamed protein product [Medioppia subpectinata]